MKKPYHFLIIIISILLYSCNAAVESPYDDVVLEQKSGLPDGGLSSAVSFVIDGKAYVMLGRNSSNGLNNACFEYSPENNTWKKNADFPGEGRVNAFAAVVNHRAYVGLGFTPGAGIYQQSSYLKDFWCYNPADSSWTKMADYPSTSTDKPIAFVVNDEIFVGFGFNGFYFTNEMWKYNTSTNTWTELDHAPIANRATGVLATDGSSVFFGTGYDTNNLNDWWQYYPDTQTWEKRKAMPDNGRVNALAFSVENRFFVATGRYFGGTLTGGHLKNDIMEYDTEKDVWYFRGSLKEVRENAISFVIDGKAYIGFGENDSTVLNDLWCFKP